MTQDKDEAINEAIELLIDECTEDFIVHTWDGEDMDTFWWVDDPPSDVQLLAMYSLVDYYVKMAEGAGEVLTPRDVFLSAMYIAGESGIEWHKEPF